ncbi:hypothetical protein D9M73_202120 [compost metagenome]
MHVVGNDQADLGAGVVRAQHHDLVLELGVVLAVGSRQPGGEGGVQVATGHALPHDGWLHGFQFDAVTEFLLEDFAGDVGGGDAVVPAVHEADLQGRFVRGVGHAHAEGKGGDAEGLEVQGFQLAHTYCSIKWDWQPTTWSVTRSQAGFATVPIAARCRATTGELQGSGLLREEPRGVTGRCASSRRRRRPGHRRW